MIGSSRLAEDRAPIYQIREVSNRDSWSPIQRSPKYRVDNWPNQRLNSSRSGAWSLHLKPPNRTSSAVRAGHLTQSDGRIACLPRRLATPSTALLFVWHGLRPRYRGRRSHVPRETRPPSRWLRTRGGYSTRHRPTGRQAHRLPRPAKGRECHPLIHGQGR
jgi:hypothetical protein